MIESKYSLALSILNDLVGLRFDALQRAQNGLRAKPEEIIQLQNAFEASFQQRDDLRTADEASLQSIIDTAGAEVKRAVDAMRSQPA